MTSPPMEKTTPSAGRAVWFLYTLIVLEILFMVSPIAAYYYAVYGVPLNALAENSSTAWLTQHILPHFTYSSSLLVNAAIAVSWPLILLGLVAFLVGFGQIYWTRFRGGDAVAGGLYRHIRHPQYVALAVVGLGTTLYWSRFLVLIAFVTMLCLYSLLARHEERACLRRYGDAYRDYMGRTGRFLPQRLERLASRFAPALPGNGWRRAAAGLLLGTALVTLTVAAGWQFRAHTLSSLQISGLGPHTLLFVAPLGEADRRQTAELLAGSLGDEPRLVYLVPASWNVPELGLQADSTHPPAAGAELAYPTTHGNPGGYARERIRALVTRPKLRDVSASSSLLEAAIRVDPLEITYLDLTAGSVSSPEPAGSSFWGTVPVPVY